jgi:hypothetical protein
VIVHGSRGGGGRRSPWRVVRAGPDPSRLWLRAGAAARREGWPRRSRPPEGSHRRSRAPGAPGARLVAGAGWRHGACCPGVLYWSQSVRVSLLSRCERLMIYLFIFNLGVQLLLQADGEVHEDDIAAAAETSSPSGGESEMSQTDHICLMVSW